MEIEKPKKPNIIPAIIFFGLLCPFAFSAFLFQAISTSQAITPMVLLVGVGFPLFCWGLLAWMIVQSRKPIKVLTEEEKKLKQDKEGRQVVIIVPFFIIAIMVLSKNYTNWILWTLLALFLSGWIQFLPDAIKKPVNEFASGIFKVIGAIIIGALIIVLIIAFFSGLAAMSTTNLILLFILWSIWSKD